MPNPNAVVDQVREVAPAVQASDAARLSAARPPLSVQFSGGQVGMLNMSDPRSAIWVEVLSSLRSMEQPAYVEIDPHTQYVTLLLCPLLVRVGVMVPIPDGYEVELIISHALHFLRRDRPLFEEMLATLQAAQKDQTELLVTETLDEHVIIDVRRAMSAVRPAAPAPSRRRR